MLIKLRAPNLDTSMSIDGRPVAVSYDGSVLVTAKDAVTLKQSHGFVDWDGAPEEGADLDKLSHAQLIGLAMAKAREQIEALDPELVREKLKAELDAKNAAPDDESLAAVSLAGDLSEPAIVAMNRIELFAYLKAKGVSAPPPIGNSRLREIALETYRQGPASAASEPAPGATQDSDQAPA